MSQVSPVAALQHSDDSDLRLTVPAWAGGVRMLIGLCQGLLLYVLYHSWQTHGELAQQANLFHPLLLVTMLVPVAAISSLVHIEARKLLVWIGLLVLLFIGLALHHAWRADLGHVLTGKALLDWRSSRSDFEYLPMDLVGVVAIGLFIAQSMVLAGHADRRWLASYRSYFSLAWKLSLQIAMAALFALLLWLVLFIGAELLQLVELSFLSRWILQASFNIPVLVFAFSAAIHLTDVKPAIIDSTRKLLLTVLSWLLPLTLLIVAGFLLGLCVRGLQPLWQTGSAFYVLMGTVALLVLLMNVVYQDGARIEGKSRRFLMLCLRIACILLLPLVILASYGLALRVAQHGWSVSRIQGAFGLVVAAIYALGYALAVVRTRPALGLIAPTNVLASLAILLILVLCLSPAADPARLSVRDHLARLQRGQIDADHVDMDFLRFKSGRYGLEALDAMARSQDSREAPLKQWASEVLASSDASPWDFNRQTTLRKRVEKVNWQKNLHVYPEGLALPASFLATDWQSLDKADDIPDCLRRSGPSAQCDAYLTKLPGRRGEVIVLLTINSWIILLAEKDDQQWGVEGWAAVPWTCRNKLVEELKQGRLTFQVVSHPEIQFAGQSIAINRPASAQPACQP